MSEEYGPNTKPDSVGLVSLQRNVAVSADPVDEGSWAETGRHVLAKVCAESLPPALHGGLEWSFSRMEYQRGLLTAFFTQIVNMQSNGVVVTSGNARVTLMHDKSQVRVSIYLVPPASLRLPVTVMSVKELRQKPGFAEVPENPPVFCLLRHRDFDSPVGEWRLVYRVEMELPILGMGNCYLDATTLEILEFHCWRRSL